MKKQIQIENWIKKNGCCSINLKNKAVTLHDGGLFSIEVEKIKRRKIVGYKKLPNKMVQVIFSKKAKIPDFSYSAYLGFEDIEETINYLTRLKRFLNKLGYKTNIPKR